MIQRYIYVDVHMTVIVVWLAPPPLVSVAGPCVIVMGYSMLELIFPKCFELQHRRLSYSRHAVNERDLGIQINYKTHMNIRRRVGERKHHHKRSKRGKQVRIILLLQVQDYRFRINCGKPEYKVLRSIYVKFFGKIATKVLKKI